MVIQSFENAFKGAIKLVPVSENEWKIVCNASFIDGKPLDIRLVNNGTKWQITDKKQTLRYMNDLYELNAKDVKSCISNVLKVYGFQIQAGALIVDIPSESAIMDKFFDYIMCVGQLTNMYAFFDEPN